MLKKKEKDKKKENKVLEIILDLIEGIATLISIIFDK